ncbi:MAG: hypothetical protein RLZ98_1596 [Pseudomonadota bacterium]|jgi:hypothetical protein
MLFRLLIVSLAVLLGALPASATRTVKFGTYQSWNIIASYNDAGQFTFCSASSLYQSGTRFSIIYYVQRAAWVIQFYHSGWPERSGNTPVRLVVDGRTITSTNARFYKRSVFVDLGPAIDRVKALMRGNRLSVITNSGSSAYSLKGSFGATVQVASCFKAHYRAGSGAFAGRGGAGGAFGAPQSPSQGAFAAPPSSARPNAKVRKLTRAETLDHALSYLNRSKLPYKLLPASGNYFKNFPVNWSYGPNSYGGMMILKGASKKGEDQLAHLLGDQARLCNEKSATSRRPLEQTKTSTIYRATGACSTGGKQFALHYTVLESQDRATQVLIIEMIHAADAKTAPGIGKEKQWRIDKIETEKLDQL